MTLQTFFEQLAVALALGSILYLYLRSAHNG